MFSYYILYMFRDFRQFNKGRRVCSAIIHYTCIEIPGSLIKVGGFV